MSLAGVRAWLQLVDAWLARNDVRLTRVGIIVLVLACIWFAGRSLM